MEQVRDVFLQELLVGSSRRRLIRGVDGFLDLAGFDEFEHARQEHGLGLETSLVVTVREDKEDILENRDVELAEEDARRLHIRLGHIVHEFKAHGKTRVLHLAVVVLGGPHAGIDDELELSTIQLEEGWETIQVDCLEELEELDAVLGVFVEILVNHLQGAAEDAVHNGGNLILHQGLYASC